MLAIGETINRILTGSEIATVLRLNPNQLPDVCAMQHFEQIYLHNRQIPGCQDFNGFAVCCRITQNDSAVDDDIEGFITDNNGVALSGPISSAEHFPRQNNFSRHHVQFGIPGSGLLGNVMDTQFMITTAEYDRLRWALRVPGSSEPIPQGADQFLMDMRSSVERDRGNLLLNVSQANVGRVRLETLIGCFYQTRCHYTPQNSNQSYALFDQGNFSRCTDLIQALQTGLREAHPTVPVEQTWGQDMQSYGLLIGAAVASVLFTIAWGFGKLTRTFPARTHEIVDNFEARHPRMGRMAQRLVGRKTPEIQQLLDWWARQRNNTAANSDDDQPPPAGGGNSEMAAIPVTVLVELIRQAQAAQPQDSTEETESEMSGLTAEIGGEMVFLPAQFAPVAQASYATQTEFEEALAAQNLEPIEIITFHTAQIGNQLTFITSDLADLADASYASLAEFMQSAGNRVAIAQQFSVPQAEPSSESMLQGILNYNQQFGEMPDQALSGGNLTMPNFGLSTNCAPVLMPAPLRGPSSAPVLRPIIVPPRTVPVAP
ncbi:MAG: hypothetical protein ABH859_01870 [Pseudomonadota bacterium]